METKLANHPVGITHPGTLFWDLCDTAKVMYRASDSYLAPCKDEHYSCHSFALCDNDNNIRPATELPLVSRRRRTQKKKVVIKKKRKSLKSLKWPLQCWIYVRGNLHTSLIPSALTLIKPNLGLVAPVAKQPRHPFLIKDKKIRFNESKQCYI